MNFLDVLLEEGWACERDASRALLILRHPREVEVRVSTLELDRIGAAASIAILEAMRAAGEQARPGGVSIEVSRDEGCGITASWVQGS